MRTLILILIALTAAVAPRADAQTPPTLPVDFSPGTEKQRENLLSSATSKFSFDSVGRLVSSRVDVNGTPVEQRDYTLDQAGNRVSVTGGADAGNYTMDPTLPQPADRQVNRYTTTPFDTRTYDKNGNLIAINPGTPTQRTFAYDFRNRLVSCNDAATGRSVTYRYDSLGRRIEKVVTPSAGSPVTTRYLFNGPHEIEERDGAGAVLATFSRGRGGVMLAMQRGGERFYFHLDAVRNTVALTDSTGAVRERYDYAVFGQPRIFTPNGQLLPASVVGNPWLYRGLFYDVETGLYQSGGICFDPRAARTVNRLNPFSDLLTTHHPEPPPAP